MTDYSEEQRNELEALESIYPDSFTGRTSAAADRQPPRGRVRCAVAAAALGLPGRDGEGDRQQVRVATSPAPLSSSEAFRHLRGTPQEFSLYPLFLRNLKVRARLARSLESVRPGRHFDFSVTYSRQPEI